MIRLLSILFLICLCLATPFPLAGQSAPPTPWISYPTAQVLEYGVYHFRKSFDLTQVPDQLIVHVSADNRYNLFVNGRRVCYGPAKGDLQTYKYDVVDIAPFLQPGNNQLAALVYQAGKDKPMSFFSVQTAFFLRAADSTFSAIDTDAGWKVYQNPAYRPVSYYEMLFKERWFYGYYACGPGDEVFADTYPWGWEQADFDDSEWQAAEVLRFQAEPWKLVPRNIPFMADHRESPARIRQAKGVDIPSGFLSHQGPITVPAHTQASILLDYEIFTMGYPELTVDRGKGASIQIKYAEALYEAVNLKAHRDSVDGLTMYGVWDVFHADGARRTFRPLWKRAFRYVQLNIQTGAEPLEVHTFESEYSGYPYPNMATFTSNDPRLNEIFEMCLRTLRMCSGETYYDTPYYEQLSYGGDNRPIAALSTYNSTDDRLLREVMRLYPQSVNKETGLFKSAYPSRFDFDMGSWSLAWIQSLHDYYYIRGDSAYIRPFVDDIEGVLRFYERHLDESLGILGTVKNQNFMDWSITKGSIPRSNERREMIHSTMLSLYVIHTLDCTEWLFTQLGLTEKAQHWAALADRMKAAVYTHCWDPEAGLFADHPGEKVFSQHSNILAILCDVVTPTQQQTLMTRILSEDLFTEYASSYFSFLLFKAMVKTGMEERLVGQFDFWQQYLDRGHTTAGETGFASHDRSDCHAWSAHPAYYLLSSVCGIQPGSIGFGTVRIEPHLNGLTSVSATLPHPQGEIRVAYQVKGQHLEAEIILPAGLSGEWVWGESREPLDAGSNRLRVNLD